MRLAQISAAEKRSATAILEGLILGYDASPTGVVARPQGRVHTPEDAGAAATKSEKPVERSFGPVRVDPEKIAAFQRKMARKK